MNIGSILKVIGQGALKGAQAGDSLNIGGLTGIVFKAVMLAGQALGSTGAEKRVEALKTVAATHPDADSTKVALAMTLMVEAMKLLESAEAK